MKKTEDTDKMENYYEYSGFQHGVPLSLCVNSFRSTLFHQHRSLELVYILDGEYRLLTETVEERLMERDAAVIPQDEIHMLRLVSESGRGAVLIIQIDVEKLPQAYFDGNAAEFATTVLRAGSGPAYDETADAVAELAGILTDEQSPRGTQISLAALKLFDALDRNLGRKKAKTAQSNSDIAKCLEIVKFIGDNLQNDIGLEEVAAQLHFSPGYTSRFFKRYMDLTFTKYLARSRIRASLEDLVEGKLTISDIAAKYGLANTKAYTNYFKEFYEVTPNVYRSRFSSRETSSEYDRRNGYMLPDDGVKRLLSHLVDEHKSYRIDCRAEGGREVRLQTDDLLIRNIDYCIDSSNFPMIDDAVQTLGITNFVIDCQSRIEEGLEDREFYYGFAEFITHIGTLGKNIVFVDRDGKLQDRLYRALEFLLAKYEHVGLTFTSEAVAPGYAEESESFFVQSIAGGRPILCSLLAESGCCNVVDNNNYKSDYFFALAMSAKMAGRILLCEDGILVTKSSTKVKILLYNDKTLPYCRRRICDIRLDGLTGTLIKTEYYVDDLFGSANSSPQATDSLISVANKHRLYIRGHGRFGHMTELLRAEDPCSITRTVGKNMLMVITVSVP
jgi:AraC-like DNA-binding protein